MKAESEQKSVHMRTLSSLDIDTLIHTIFLRITNNSFIMLVINE